MFFRKKAKESTQTIKDALKVVHEEKDFSEVSAPKAPDVEPVMFNNKTEIEQKQAESEHKNGELLTGFTITLQITVKEKNAMLDVQENLFDFMEGMMKEYGKEWVSKNVSFEIANNNGWD